MKFKLPKLVIGLAAACAISGLANADGLTQLPTTGGGYVTSIGNSGASSFYFGAFTDSFSVSFAAPSNFTATAAAINGDGNTTGIDLGLGEFLPATTASVTETLLNSSNQVVNTFISNSNGVASGTFSSLKAGTYTLQVSTANDGTNFSGYSLSTSVAAVPEPSEGALLLSGIGLLGYIAARRKTA